MAQITEFKSLPNHLSKIRHNKTIGLITGCFDVIHVGHLSLFQKAKEHVDILVVSLECDLSIKANKGFNRPINSETDRLNFLSAINYLDYIYLIEHNHFFNSDEYVALFQNMLMHLSPNYLITTPATDSGWKEKQDRIELNH